MSTAGSHSYVLHTMGSGLCYSCPPARSELMPCKLLFPSRYHEHIHLCAHCSQMLSVRDSKVVLTLCKEIFLQVKGLPGKQYHLPQPKPTDDPSPKQPAARLLYLLYGRHLENHPRHQPASANMFIVEKGKVRRDLLPAPPSSRKGEDLLERCGKFSEMNFCSGVRLWKDVQNLLSHTCSSQDAALKRVSKKQPYSEDKPWHSLFLDSLELFPTLGRILQWTLPICCVHPCDPHLKLDLRLTT